MKDQKVEIVQELLSVIDQKKFDLEAWKIKASLALKIIFGDDDEKVRLIQNLHYDFSSWSLRDNSGGKKHDPIKDQAREIIESAILELKHSDNQPQVIALMRSQLTGDEFDQLQLLIENNRDDEASLIEYFSKIAPAKKDAILTQIILKLI